MKNARNEASEMKRFLLPSNLNVFVVIFEATSAGCNIGLEAHEHSTSFIPKVVLTDSSR